MSNKKENNIFIQHLKDVKPIKKNNKITRPLPKKQETSRIKNKLENTERKKTFDKIQDANVKSKLIVEKSNINKKLKKGKIPINKKIDFHGCSLEEAKKIFLNTIDDCFLKNHRCILFITGKGVLKKNVDGNKENKLYYGKIRNNFINWITLPSVQSKILNMQQASFEHGGDGAFFVYLRKNKN